MEQPPDRHVLLDTRGRAVWRVQIEASQAGMWARHVRVFWRLKRIQFSTAVYECRWTCAWRGLRAVLQQCTDHGHRTLRAVRSQRRLQIGLMPFTERASYPCR